jgi:hypothetical protein
MLTGKQRYWQAMRKAGIQADRSLRHMMEGTGDFAECRMDLERDALIKELDRAFNAGRNSSLSPPLSED